MKNGFAFKSTEYTDEGTPVIRISDINGGIVSTEKSVRVKDKNEFEDFLVEKGDILVAMSGATTGKFGLFGTNEKAYQNQRVGKFKILNIKVLDRQFLYYQINSLKRLIEKDAYGGAQPNISSGKIEQMNFVLPPLPIQHAIVTKIEEIFSELDHGVEQLKVARAQLKVYRQAVLKWAFEGRLTNEWRAKNNMEDSKDILNRIHREKGIITKATGNRYKTLPILDEEKNEMPILPQGWSWARPDDFSSPEKYSIGIGPFGSNLKVSDYKKEGVPLIFVKNITRNDFKIDQRFISTEKYHELVAHSVKPLDLLITKMGDPPGDCEIYPEFSQPAILTSDCLKFRIWDVYADRKFYKYCMETDLIKKQLGLRTQGVAQKKISSERFKTILFPYPPLPEQHQIVSEIERRLSVCDKLEETIEAGLKQSEVLRAGVLKMAFEGRLV